MTLATVTRAAHDGMMAQIISGLFDRYEDAEGALAALRASGVAEGDIGLIVCETDKPESASVSPGSDNPTPDDDHTSECWSFTVHGLGPVKAAGWLASVLRGTTAAKQGLIKALVDAGVSEDHAHLYAENVRRGGTLVSAMVGDDQITSAWSVLSEERAVNIAGRLESYREEGWSSFDETATPYDPERYQDH